MILNRKRSMWSDIRVIRQDMHLPSDVSTIERRKVRRGNTLVRVLGFPTSNCDEDHTAPIDDIDAESQLRTRHKRMIGPELANI